MAREEAGPDFIEALARGLDVLRSFHPGRLVSTLSEIAADTGLARPTVRRILLTLEVARTNESTSMAQLDGSDITYVARVAVPKIVTLSVRIGTRFPAVATSMGKVLLAALTPEQLDNALAEESRSGITPKWRPSFSELDRVLREVRAKGWALADQDLAPGIRSIATGVRDGEGRIVAAVNITVHAAETSVETLTGEYLPMLLHTAAEIGHDWALLDSVPSATYLPETDPALRT
jgi:IclR family pca regulon transcriptional regulator